MRINFKKIFSLVIFTFSLLAGDTYHVMARDREQKYKLVFREEFNLPDGSQPNPKLWSRVPRANNLWAKWNSDTADVVLSEMEDWFVGLFRIRILQIRQ